MSASSNPIPRLAPIRSRKQRRTKFIASATKGLNKILIENHTSTTTSCEFDRTGKLLLSANNRGQIYICDTVDEFDRLAYLKGHVLPVTEVHFSADGSRVFSSSSDGSVLMWDTCKGCEIGELIGHTDSANSVQCSQREPWFICSGSSDKTVRVWDTRTRVCVTMIVSYGSVSSTCFSNCGQYIFCAGSRDGCITALDMRMNEVIRTLSGHREAVTGLAVSPCGNFLASCAADDTVRSWDISSVDDVGGDIKHSQFYHVDQNGPFHMIRCAWSADGSMLAAGTAGRRVPIFDSKTNKVLHSLDGHSGMIIDVAFHPTKPLVMSAGTDRYLILHDL